MTSLRDEQRQLGKERILQALAEELTEKGLVELSVPAVAARAGVSVRTVYNYFENREALLSGLSEWGDELIKTGGGRIVETDPDRMADAIRANFRLFSELDSALLRALFVISEARIAGEIPRDRGAELTDERTKAIREMVDVERPDLSVDERAALASMMRIVPSADTWRKLTELGLSGETAGVVAAWAFDALLASTRSRATPFD